MASYLSEAISAKKREVMQVSGYTFQLRDMDPQAREKAAGAAKKTLHMKDRAGAELAAPMLKARDIIDQELLALRNRQGLTFGNLPKQDCGVADPEGG